MTRLEFQNIHNINNEEMERLELVRAIFGVYMSLLVIERSKESWEMSKWIECPEDLGSSHNYWRNHVAHMQSLQGKVPQKKKQVILFLQRSMRQQIQKSGGTSSKSR